MKPSKTHTQRIELCEPPDNGPVPNRCAFNMRRIDRLESRMDRVEERVTSVEDMRDILNRLDKRVEVLDVRLAGLIWPARIVAGCIITGIVAAVLKLIFIATGP